MCNYCEAGIKIFVNEDRYKLGVFIDQGYLKHIDLEYRYCLDHWKEIRLNFCPFCGVKFEHERTYAEKIK